MALLRRVRPGLTDEEIGRMRASFEIERNRKIDLRVYEITVTGDQAQAKGRREDSVVLNSGQRLRTESQFTFGFKRTSNRWVIQEAKQS